MTLSICARRLAQPKFNLIRIPKRKNGYVILLPEINDTGTQQRPNVANDLDFSQFTGEACVARVTLEAAEFEDYIKQYGAIVENNPSVDLFKRILNPMEKLLTSLLTTWSTASLLTLAKPEVLPNEVYTKVHKRAALAAASRYVSVPIFEASKRLLDDKNANLSHEQKRVLQKIIMEGKFHGLELKGRDKTSFQFSWHQAFDKMAEFELRTSESIRILSPTIKDYDTVRELPKLFLKQIAKDPKHPEAGPWKVTLHDGVVETFLEYCSDSSWRAKVWELHVTKASLYQERLLQNSSALEELRDRQHTKARRLGYNTYVDLSLETKMAESLDSIYNTFNILVDAARPVQEQEIKELTEFANRRAMVPKINEWDIPFYSRKYMTEKFKYTEEDIKAYLPLSKVLDGLFRLVENLYNIKIEETKKLNVWSPDVRVFHVFDLKRSTTEPAGSFYLDPYYREGETANSGYFIPIRNKSKVTGTTPLVGLVFNFPRTEQGCLLTISATNTLFEKFGRMLQCVLTTVEHMEVSGTNFISWDAAKISDYFMANWLYEPTILKQISEHYETGDTMPEDVIETVRKRRTYLAGYKLCKELYLSHMDLEMHSSNRFWVSIMKRLWSKYFVLPLFPTNSYFCSWTSVITGNGAAAYYCDLWSAMLAADLFSAVHEISIDNPEEVKQLSERYRETFLALGGTYPTAELFRRCRGRDPSPQALIENLGLSKTIAGEKISATGER